MTAAERVECEAMTELMERAAADTIAELQVRADRMLLHLGGWEAA